MRAGHCSTPRSTTSTTTLSASLAGISGIELLDFEVHEQTNFALLATVGIDPRTQRLFLLVNGDPQRVTAMQAHEYANTFMRVLAAIARSPEQAIDLGADEVTARERTTRSNSRRLGCAGSIGRRAAYPGEAVLVDVFASVLGVESVGVHDNFFTIGGDSILALVVRSKAEKRGIAFDIDELFARPTVAELAESSSRPAPEPQGVTERVRIASADRPRGAARRRGCVPSDGAATRHAVPQHRACRIDDV